jgi:selenocysteine-specific elongation factor
VVSRPLTVGTAGHIDHGKTALVRALTGIDTDRLPQERRRGISIELGFAPLVLPSGRRLSVVDAPGHERFVRTMVAGATGVDLYLMTIAADDGVMPQTREHAAVLRALAVNAGVVAITKADLADPARTAAEAAELMPGSEAVAVSARTGAGLGELGAALERVAERLPGRSASGRPLRLHVDRAFSIRGAGTVVTGTLWSGTLGRGDVIEISPSGHRARVRAVQVHDQPVERAEAGQRVAVNLTGVAVSDVQRGEVVLAAGSELRPSYILDCALNLGAHGGIDDHARVQVHHGTRETAARLTWLGGRFWQVRCEQPLIAQAGDRLVIRRISPPDTLGGGTVLDSNARKHGPSREATGRLSVLASGGDPGTNTAAEAPPARHSRPPGPSERRRPNALPGSAVVLERRLLEAGLEPPNDAELPAAELEALRQTGRAVRVSASLHYHPEVLSNVQRQLVALARRSGDSVTLAQVRDELGTSRKFAQALLEHLDSERVFLRRGELHVLRRAHASAPLD